MTYPTRQAEPSGEGLPLAVSRLWRQLPADRRQQAAEAFWADPDGAEHHAEALAWLARQLNFRLKSVQRLPADRRARHLATLRGVPDSIAIRMLIAYHLDAKREMMAAFLDELGIAHDKGVITEENLTAPEPARLAEAAAALAAAHAQDDVHLYFSTLVAQDPATWGGLAVHVSRDTKDGQHEGTKGTTNGITKI